jgi:hypothetical protein
MSEQRYKMRDMNGNITTVYGDPQFFEPLVDAGVACRSLPVSNKWWEDYIYPGINFDPPDSDQENQEKAYSVLLPLKNQQIQKDKNK